MIFSFFASELNFAIDSYEELLVNLEQNPIPYMMLLAGADSPIIINEGESTYNKEPVWLNMILIPPDTSALSRNFKIEYNRDSLPDGAERIRVDLLISLKLILMKTKISSCYLQ